LPIIARSSAITRRLISAPTNIHRIGLDEVKRIRAEMDKIIAAVGFKGSFSGICALPAHGSEVLYTDPTELLHGYMVIAKGIDPKSRHALRQAAAHPLRRPRHTGHQCAEFDDGVLPAPAADGSRPGYYYVNLYKPDARRTEMGNGGPHQS